MAGQLFILHSNYFKRCRATVDKKYAGYYTLQFMTEGGIHLQYDQRMHALRGAWLWPCWPGPHIRFHRLPDQKFWVHRYVAFRGPLVAEWQEMGLLPFEPQQPRNSDEFRDAFDALLALAERSDRWGHLRAVNQLELILLRLAEERQESVTPWLDQIHTRLSAQGTLWPDYERLAQEMGMGLSTLRRKYRQTTHTSLHATVLGQRIAAARQLLTETSLPVKEIAHRLEYRDVYFFSRQFRAVAGVSPAAFRRSRHSLNKS